MVIQLRATAWGSLPAAASIRYEIYPLLLYSAEDLAPALQMQSGTYLPPDEYAT